MTKTKRLPFVLAVFAILALAVGVSAGGALFFRKPYQTIDESGSHAGTSVEGTGKNTSLPSGETSAIAGEVPHRITATGDFDPDVFDAAFYTKRLYALKYLFAVDEFDEVSDLPVSAAVQFAFCHLYYDSLVDMPEERPMLLRQVMPASISTQLEKLFGDNSLDITKSDLYNAEKKLFEMWQPSHRTPVYANADCTSKEDNSYELTATFFTSHRKDRIDCVVVGVFKKQHGHYTLDSMETE